MSSAKRDANLVADALTEAAHALVEDGKTRGFSRFSPTPEADTAYDKGRRDSRNELLALAALYRTLSSSL